MNMNMNAHISTQFRSRVFICALTGALIAGGAVVAMSEELGKKSDSGRADTVVPLDENAVARDTLPHGSYAPVVKLVAPAVVKIETTTVVKSNPEQDFPGFNDPFWQQ